MNAPLASLSRRARVCIIVMLGFGVLAVVGGVWPFLSARAEARAARDAFLQRVTERESLEMRIAAMQEERAGLRKRLADLGGEPPPLGALNDHVAELARRAEDRGLAVDAVSVAEPRQEGSAAMVGVSIRCRGASPAAAAWLADLAACCPFTSVRSIELLTTNQSERGGVELRAELAWTALAAEATPEPDA